MFVNSIDDIEDIWTDQCSNMSFKINDLFDEKISYGEFVDYATIVVCESFDVLMDIDRIEFSGVSIQKTLPIRHAYRQVFVHELENNPKKYLVVNTRIYSQFSNITSFPLCSNMKYVVDDWVPSQLKGLVNEQAIIKHFENNEVYKRIVDTLTAEWLIAEVKFTKRNKKPAVEKTEKEINIFKKTLINELESIKYNLSKEELTNFFKMDPNEIFEIYKMMTRMKNLSQFMTEESIESALEVTGISRIMKS